jgi:hypothetical protein
MNAPPPLAAVPPLLSPPKSSSLRTPLAFLLSLYLGLFLTDGGISLVDDSLIVFCNVHILGTTRGILAVLSILMAIVIYVLMGITPMIPKRLFLPLTLFIPVALLAAVPFVIYFHNSIRLIGWGISLCQVILGLSILYRVQGGLKFHWPLIAENQLEVRGFSWRNVVAFLLANVFVMLPGAVIYLFFCTALAVGYFSEGFVALRSGGFTVQARKYIRDDGKTVQLFPMSHVAERSFYRMLSESFTTNSIILMEGVTDEKGLLTNRISYQRMAKSLGVAEQQKEFKPVQGEIVRADVDVEQFTTNTIGFLNLIMLVHSKGLNPELLMQVILFSPAPGFEQELIDDLLRKRNRHLVEELRSRLSQSEMFVVPWGAAHMPEIAREIQTLGFHLDETRDFTVIRFRSAEKK